MINKDGIAKFRADSAISMWKFTGQRRRYRQQKILRSKPKAFVVGRVDFSTILWGDALTKKSMIRSIVRAINFSQPY